MARWTYAEDRMVRDNYPRHGPSWDGWADVLPHRTKAAIASRAGMLGVTKGPAMVATDDDILSAIAAHWDERGYAPSMRDVMRAVGLRSPSTVYYRIERLKEEGLVDFDPLVQRSIRLTGRNEGHGS